MKVLKNICAVWIASILFIWNSYANLEDNSIEQELNKTKAQELQFDFKMKQFSSCENMEDVMSDYVKDYWKNSYRGRYDYYDDDMAIDLNTIPLATEETSMQKTTSDFSKTNTQVKGVDESDIIKTDGKYIYYYNKTDKFVYVVDAQDKLTIVKKISIPKHMNSPVLYLDENRLVVVSNGQAKWKIDRSYYFNRSTKTYTIVFDTTDIKNPKLIKLFVNDWYVSKTRKIGDYLYVLSENNFNFNYYSYKYIDDIKLDGNLMLPQSIEMSRVDDKNTEINGKKIPYEIKSWNMAECNEIAYVLPDKETLKKFDFSPAYNTISVINIRDQKEEVIQEVIAWSNAEIFMSSDNLYMTSNIYQANDYKCPVGAHCIMPWYPRGENTLIHKISVNQNKLFYKNSSILPGRPLTQYSMDQHNGEFRIITQESYPVRQTSVYILDEDMDLKSSISWLGKTENFKSSRFMWDKLYLVTFKQIDPFYVVDLEDSSNPRVIWELKIPWYSTYLHPYDEKHIIWLWYDTIENKWGGTMNGWVKVDLYEINFDKKVSEVCAIWEEKEQLECFKSSWIEVKNIQDAKTHKNYNNIFVRQKFTETIWNKGSYTEALNNPRMFMWNSIKNTLLLPVKITKTDSENHYRQVWLYQGLLALDINKDSWIKEKYRVTHIDATWLEEKRMKACESYVPKKEETICRKLINGTEYCPSQKNIYIPKYCYADSPISEYFANQYWNYRDSFVERALWIGDKAYSFSNDQIKSVDFNTWKLDQTLNLK